MRIGYGFDSHEFREGVPLVIGGVRLEHDKGLAGHSDGDVLLHALTDALLGAVAAGDIGSFFPPSDPKWKGADSSLFLEVALQQIEERGYEIANVDATLVLAAPRIGPHAAAIRQRVAEILKLSTDCVGLKAKTPEGLNLDNTAAAHAVVLLERHEEHQRMEQMASVLEAQKHLEEVVADLVSGVHTDQGTTLIRTKVIDTEDIT